MAAQRHKTLTLECWKTSHEWALLSNCFMMNLKLQNAAQRRFVFVDWYVVQFLSCVAWLSRTFSTFFGSFMNTQLGRVYISAWVSRFALVTEIIKWVEKLVLFACLVFFRTLCETVYKFQASCFDELSFCPRAGVPCLVKCDESRFPSSVFTSLWRP